MSKAIDVEHEEMHQERSSPPSTAESLAALHSSLRRDYDFVHRIGVTIHDDDTGCLKTFAQVADGENSLPKYQYSLGEVNSFEPFIPGGRPRVINDVLDLDGRDEHRWRLQSQGYRSSYTVPARQDDKLAGFVFFNSREPGVFRQQRLPELDQIARQFSQLANMELRRA